jgi:hypothetical protein
LWQRFHACSLSHSSSLDSLSPSTSLSIPPFIDLEFDPLNNGMPLDIEDTESITSELEQEHDIQVRNINIFSKFLHEAQAKLDPKIMAGVRGAKEGIKAIYHGLKINGEHASCTKRWDQQKMQAMDVMIKDNWKKTVIDQKKWLLDDFFPHQRNTEQEASGFILVEKVVVNLTNDISNDDGRGHNNNGREEIGSLPISFGPDMYKSFKIDDSSFFVEANGSPNLEGGRGSEDVLKKDKGDDSTLQTPKAANSQ